MLSRLRADLGICHTFGFMLCSVFQRRWIAVAMVALMTLCGAEPVAAPPDVTSGVRLQYGIEWRMIRAGNAVLSFSSPQDTPNNARVNLLSSGLVSKLFPVDDRYVANFSGGGCATDVWLQAQEGTRKRETTIKFDRPARHANYVERDLVKNQVILNSQLTVPDCSYEVLGGLQALRRQKLEPGQSTQMALTDGKRLVSARIEAQEREQVKTPLGTFKTIRYEAFLFNNVLYQRKGRLFIWVSDDEQRLPVQIRVQLQLHIGTVTLQLEKEDRT